MVIMHYFADLTQNQWSMSVITHQRIPLFPSARNITVLLPSTGWVQEHIHHGLIKHNFFLHNQINIIEYKLNTEFVCQLQFFVHYLSLFNIKRQLQQNC